MSLKNKIFMFKKLIIDLKRGDDYYNICSDNNFTTLGEYYFIFEEQRVEKGKDQALIRERDDNGIPLNQTYIDVSEKKLYYSPISIGQMGLAVFHTFLDTENQKDLERFLKFADWFVENADVDTKLGARWLTDVTLPAYHRTDKWQSAFSQSRAISILLRAYQRTGKDDYKNLAEKALNSFKYPVADGGVYSETKWGPFYEEYTADIPILVLNGHIFALFGLYDFCRVFPENNISKNLFNSGVQTVLNAIPDFDLGFWTRYNYCVADFYPSIDPATLTYQRLHIMQLRVMYSIFQDNYFDEVLQMWTKQINAFNYLRSGYIKYRALKKLNRL